MANVSEVVCAALLVTSLAPRALAQSVISAHSGVIHYVEGDVTIDGTPVHPKFAEFPDVKAGQLVATAEGRAEILLQCFGPPGDLTGIPDVAWDGQHLFPGTAG